MKGPTREASDDGRVEDVKPARRRKLKPKNSTKPGMRGRIEIRVHIEED